ncbi:translational GTPase TypA [Sulfurovum sp. bin170]|uniref:translational GTPase TypA n=1 Tax=Sulfurovum sp. bin170 TaxID=2695268 RepID=UPI0013DFCDC4|nr:translational GTPase TypA [Sulfurovum sp. bin170]NEW59929.1 translational GTPase TypA [Sulfurovum sp. bin170]
MQKIKNIAVIAHVDHGKTTLVDQLLQQSGTYEAHQEVTERAMDSNEIEKERGITILSKNTAITYGDHKINIIDTPGHADFGGEVERVLKMVDGVLLLVDAQEGVMPQTKFVLKKAIELGLIPVVVINKIDKDGSEPDRVMDEVFDLLVALDANDEQLEFPVLYAAARDGYAKWEMEDEDRDMTPLFDAIIQKVPYPKGSADNDTQAQVFTLASDNFVGRIGITRIFNGRVKRGDEYILVKACGEKTKSRISKLIGFKGLERLDIDEAEAGDIVAIAGFNDIDVGDSVCDAKNPVALDPMHVEEPTLSVVVSVNDGPLAGTEGKHVTSNKIRERLAKEMETNIAMRMEPTGDASFKVSGRGELQIGILAENMRREGFEFLLARPEVVTKVENGVKMEPFEHLVVDVPSEFQGVAIEKLGKRKAEMTSLVPMPDGTVRLEFEIPARGLIGFRSEFLTDTKGEGIMNHSYMEYRPYSGSVESRTPGALVSMDKGEAVAFSIFNLQARGTMFIKPQDKVYDGMVIGESSRPGDLEVNPLKGKALTNMRTSGTDEAVKLVKPRDISLESAMEWIEDDELIEITPMSVRIRKKALDSVSRRRIARDKKNAKA